MFVAIIVKIGIYLRLTEESELVIGKRRKYLHAA